jgi:acetyl esterase/lipase
MPFETVRYGPHEDNIGDLRRGEAGLVALVHGGIWRHQYRRDIMESLAVDLSGRGYHTWNVEYRTLGTGGGWPGSGHDVLTALDHAPRLGLGPVRAVVGHSAGGYLAMWAAPRSASPVALCVGLAPIVDLDDAVESADVLAHESRLLRDAGAPTPVDPEAVPTVLVHGPADETVPIRHSTLLAQRRGLDILEFDGGHLDLLDPSKPHWGWVLERVGSAGGLDSTYLSTDR